MTGKVFDSSATGLLILILPFALAIVLLYQLWPILLALAILIISFKIWQNYQWQKWSEQVNPYFNQLIRDNQGCLTPLDLSLKANLSGKAARQFLELKAKEYGAQRKEITNKGEVYYFMTASALGSIFDDSEPVDDEETLSTTPSLLENKQQQISIGQIAQLAKQEQSEVTSADAEATLAEDKISKGDSIAQQAEAVSVEEDLTKKTSEKEKETKESSTSETDAASTPAKEQTTEKSEMALIQEDLAKRLDLHSSTVGRRKSEPNFPEYSQSKDPEGIAWKYVPETKMFIPVDNE